jgi:hypothetical protein
MITTLIAGMSMLFFTGLINGSMGYLLLTKFANSISKNI